MFEEASVFGTENDYNYYGGSSGGQSESKDNTMKKQESFGVEALCVSHKAKSNAVDAHKRSAPAQSVSVPAGNTTAPHGDVVDATKKVAPSSPAASSPPGAASSVSNDDGDSGARGKQHDDDNSSKRSTSLGSENPQLKAGPVRQALVPEMPVDPRRKYNVKGALAPQPIQRCQFRAVPTGNSDSDTDNTSQSSGGAQELSQTPHTDTSVPLTQAELDDEQQFIDEFGFIVDETTREQDEKYVKKVNGKQVIRREIKWANMAADWDRTNVKMHTKLKERCRKGIPSRFRGVAWQLLLTSGPEMASPENEGVYLALREKKLADKEVDAIISRDLARTFPHHILFREQDGVGQTFLRNVLHAYAGADPEVSYVQGMGFIVGALSTQMGEEEAFWALHQLMYNERYRMRELFRPGFPLLHQFFYQFKRLLAKLMPKLSKYFESESVDPSYYASQWFLTLFVYHFPFRSLLRIWDVFFCEGWKIIFRTGLALLKWEEKRLLSLPFEELLPALKGLQDGKDTKELIRRAHRIKFKTALLNRYGDEYWESLKNGGSV